FCVDCGALWFSCTLRRVRRLNWAMDIPTLSTAELPLPERLNRCDQDLQSFNQKVYDMSTEMRGQLRSVNALKSEIHGHVDSLALRVDRVERDVEYLQNKIPDSSDVEIEESVIEQQEKEAQQKKKAILQGKALRVPFTGTKGPSLTPEPQPHTITPPPPNFTPGTVQSGSTNGCDGVVPDCHGVTQNGSGSSSGTSPALVLVEVTNESVCGGTVVSTKMNGLLSRVTRPDSLVSLDHCSTHLSSIKSQKIVKKAGDVTGSWMKDPTKGSSRIYFFSGPRNSTLLEFVSLKAFTDTNWTRKAEIITLPLPWQGTGHVVYNGFIYYHHADTRNEVLKVHLLNRTVTDRMLLPGAGRMPAYGLSPHSLLDLAVDELGLWAIHADPDFGGNLVVTKLDSSSLAVEHTWDTNCKSHDAEGAFIICGTMYVVYNSHSGGRSTIKCLFDIHDNVLTEGMPAIFFPKRYTSHSGMHYHPKEKQVYAWDDGYQTIYKLDTKRKQAA
ncbi:hypothetical protein NFI96_005737, partial [Prochilodus magdalenae]